MRESNFLKISGVTEEIIELRRTLHRFPELGFQERSTIKFIEDFLKNLNIEIIEKIGDTGLVAVIEADLPGPTLLLRADIDGLPIIEETGLPFTSENECMHACGHDGHISILLGLARLLMENKRAIKGKVILVFQPAEEIIQGAKAMLVSDFFRTTKIDRVLGLHIWNQIELGKVAVNPDIVFASADFFKVTIYGVGGHGALPEATIDPIVIASSIILMAQTVVSRNISPNKMGVLTFGKLNGGSAANIIPQKVTLEGTIRSYDEITRITIIERLGELVEKISDSFGGRSEFKIVSGASAVINNREWAGEVAKSSSIIVGEENTITSSPISVGDDMSEFMKLAPGCYILIGAQKEGSGPHHNSKFDFDEDCLEIALRVMLETSLNYLTS